MTDTTGFPDGANDEELDALVSRLNLIDDQPLESRAASFAQLHDELQSVLEGGDSHRQHG